ncbi:MAG: MBL fold metallo-hydrolase [Oscillospiraceae bacterium]|nr:MBL fold metallo-hydrolase [Oscillospiraceae bacterium]
MKKFRKAAFVLLLAVILVMALADTSGFLTYEQMMVFLKLREPSFTEAGLSVHFIDVGQGDSTLIVSGEYSVLIDAGEKESGQTVVSYLASQNISKLDYIIATHPHSDHTGGIEDILENFETGTVIVPHFSEEGKDEEDLYTWKALKKTLENADADVCEAYPGMKLNLGVSELVILAPLGEYENPNNCSVVSELVHEDNIFLFPGDAESESEAEMLSHGVLDDIDVLKAGHHGSSTSSGGEFLEIVKPEYAVVSCGTGNSYNHPSESVMQRFGKSGVQIFRTDLQGSIVAESDGKKISFVTTRSE